MLDFAAGQLIRRAGQNHIHIIYIYGVNTAFLAGKSPTIRSNTVCIYGSGQPYLYVQEIAGAGQNRISVPYMTRVGQNRICAHRV
jgi:hypothetical protein